MFIKWKYIEISKTIIKENGELNSKENVSILLAEQNTNIALKNSDYGYIIETGNVMLEGTADELLDNDEVKELYLGISKEGRKRRRNKP